jgi:hypothetical protein
VGRLTRVRAVPWLLVFEVARGVRSHVLDTLSPAERRRVGEILRKSRGNPTRITPREREELKRLAGKLDLRRLGQDLAPRIVGSQRGRRR